MTKLVVLTLPLLCLVENIERAEAKAPLFRRSVSFPDDSSDQNVCKTSSPGTVCMESSLCRNFNRNLTRCGWSGLKVKVCCKESKLAPVSIESCGIRSLPNPSGVLRKKRENVQFDSERLLKSLESSSLLLATDVRLAELPGRVSQPQVVGGKEVEPFSYPWMAALDKKTFGSNHRFLCGASLISRRHILTAAHCFQKGDEKSPGSFTVRLKAHLKTGGTRYNVKKIEIHPRYNGRENYNDIAILVLDREVPIANDISPICLPEAERSRIRNLTNRTAYVLGWGHTSYGGVDSQVLLEARLPIVDTAQCNDAYKGVASRSYPKGITNDFLCAGYKEGGKDACQNDSGGPLQMSTNNRWFQIGIVSFGYGCAEPGFPGVYTRVARYVPWINEIMRKAS